MYRSVHPHCLLKIHSPKKKKKKVNKMVYMEMKIVDNQRLCYGIYMPKKIEKISFFALFFHYCLSKTRMTFRENFLKTFPYLHFFVIFKQNQEYIYLPEKKKREGCHERRKERKEIKMKKMTAFSGVFLSIFRCGFHKEIYWSYL